MKKSIMGFILGSIIFSRITSVAAYSILAKGISYTPSNTNWEVDDMSDVLDALYTNINPKYTGVTEVTPSQSSQTLNTKDKALTKNITINPIPSTYKNLTSATTVSVSDIVSDKKSVVIGIIKLYIT